MLTSHVTGRPPRRVRPGARAWVFVALLLTPWTQARADGYRDEMFAIDASSFVVLGGSQQLPRGARRVLETLAVAGFGFGVPALHAAHGQWDHAGVSLALRWGPPLTALGIGWACAQHHEGADIPVYCFLGAGILGASLLIAGIAIDYAWLGTRDDAAQPRTLMVSWGGAFP